MYRAKCQKFYIENEPYVVFINTLNMRKQPSMNLIENMFSETNYIEKKSDAGMIVQLFIDLFQIINFGKTTTGTCKEAIERLVMFLKNVNKDNNNTHTIQQPTR